MFVGMCDGYMYKSNTGPLRFTVNFTERPINGMPTAVAYFAGLPLCVPLRMTADGHAIVSVSHILLSAVHTVKTT